MAGELTPNQLEMLITYFILNIILFKLRFYRFFVFLHVIDTKG